MPFGSLVSNIQHPYYEQYFNTALNLAVAQGTNGFADVTSMTMPWTGDIFLTGHLQIAYDQGATVIAVEVWPFTDIGVTNQICGKATETCGNGGIVTIPLICKWANLAGGTFFKLTIRIQVGAVNGRALANNFAGTLRAQAA